MKKIFLILTCATLICSCGEKEEPAPDKPAANEIEIPDDYLDVKFVLDSTNYALKCPKGSYISEESEKVYVYLDPSDSERLVIIKSNGRVMNQLKSDFFEEREITDEVKEPHDFVTFMFADGTQGFIYNDGYLIAIYAPKEEEARNETFEKFVKITQSITEDKGEG